MLAVIATILITWAVIGLIGYLLSDNTYKECMTNEVIVFFMILLGWIPAFIVCLDLNEKL